MGYKLTLFELNLVEKSEEIYLKLNPEDLDIDAEDEHVVLYFPFGFFGRDFFEGGLFDLNLVDPIISQ